MVKVEVSEQLYKKIERKFSVSEANLILDLVESLEQSPHKGKVISHVSNYVIKELKYKKFRFYFITDGFLLKFGSKEELTNLLIKFIEMSEKKDQQEIIEKVKNVLQSLGFDDYSC